MFAVATVILYIIGLKKKMTQDDRLMDMLLNNAAHRTVTYLKEHDTISETEMGYIAQQVKAKEFLSDKVAVVADGKAFKSKLIDFMLRNNYITECGTKRGERLFCLPNKEKRK